MIGLTSPIWVPVGLAVLVGSVPFMGVIRLKEKVTNLKRSRKYEIDKLSFIVQASREYLRKMVQEQQLWLYYVLCQLLKDETRSGKDIKEKYGPLGEMSFREKEKMALFFIKELQSMEISRNDLEWDQASLLGNGASASVYRGTFRLPGQSEPTQVAVKLWSKELNEHNAIDVLSKTETLRLVTFSIFFK